MRIRTSKQHDFARIINMLVAQAQAKQNPVKHGKKHNFSGRFIWANTPNALLKKFKNVLANEVMSIEYKNHIYIVKHYNDGLFDCYYQVFKAEDIVKNIDDYKFIWKK